MLRSLLPTIAATSLAALLPVSGHGQVAWRPDDPWRWPDCSWSGPDFTCPKTYLSVNIRQGQAVLTVAVACVAPWSHVWLNADAHQTIRQWLDGDAASGEGGVCIALAPTVDEVVVTPLGGHCGYPGSIASMPGFGERLRRGGSARIELAGCHARIDTLGFGGIALRFADGYGLGDSYAQGYFYGVYDGFGDREVGGTGASVFRIGDYNTFHYRVEILANGSAQWRSPDLRDDRP